MCKNQCDLYNPKNNGVLHYHYSQNPPIIAPRSITKNWSESQIPRKHKMLSIYLFFPAQLHGASRMVPRFPTSLAHAVCNIWQGHSAVTCCRQPPLQMIHLNTHFTLHTALRVEKPPHVLCNLTSCFTFSTEIKTQYLSQFYIITKSYPN